MLQVWVQRGLHIGRGTELAESSGSCSGHPSPLHPSVELLTHLYQTSTEHLLRVSPYARDPSEWTALALEEPRATEGSTTAVSSWREQGWMYTAGAGMEREARAARARRGTSLTCGSQKRLPEEVAAELSFEG